MAKQNLLRLLAYAALAAAPVLIPAFIPTQATARQAAQAAGQQAPAATAPLRPEVAPSSVPAKTIDLMTAEGSVLFGAQWKTMEAKIVEGAPLPKAMPEYKSSYDIQPHAGEAGYDDSMWPVIDAKDLAAQRGGGKVSFIWYRANLTIPARIGDFDTTGATVVLTAYVDDYAEVWVNGQMPRRVGYPSPATIQGFNMPNRVVISNGVKPGDKFQIAVFGVNGPISVAPMNFVFFREAKIEFFR